jgi:hypothetical protein
LARGARFLAATFLVLNFPPARFFAVAFLLAVLVRALVAGLVTRFLARIFALAFAFALPFGLADRLGFVLLAMAVLPV